MRFTNIQYLEKESITVSIQNLNTSLAMLDGQVVFAANYDSLVTAAALTPPTAQTQSLGVAACTFGDLTSDTTNPQALTLGIVKVNPTTFNISSTGAASLALGGVGEAICYGFTDAIVQLRTRATSTDVWATTVAIAAGDWAVPESVNNAVKWSATLPINNAKVQFAFAQSQAISISYASSTGTINPNVSVASATVETIRMKIRVCCM